MERKHLAIFRQPFLNLILQGKKTIESRFSRVRCAPYGAISEEDSVLLKESGGLVLGEFQVERVQTFTDPTPEAFSNLKKYSKEICAEIDSKFWESRKKSRYITLIHVKNVIRYEKPYAFPKKDRRGWVILEEKQKTSVQTLDKWLKPKPKPESKIKKKSRKQSFFQPKRKLEKIEKLSTPKKKAKTRAKKVSLSSHFQSPSSIILPKIRTKS